MNGLELFLEKISDTVDYFSKAFLICIVGIMVAAILLQVFCRYVIGAPLIWPEELTTFLMAWMSFVGSAVALKKWEHLGINLLVDALQGKLQILLKLLTKFAVTIFVVFFTYQSVFLVIQSLDQVSMAMHISMIYPRLSLTVGGILMLIHLFYFLVKDFNLLLGRNS
ncbi:MAG: TRAP transporter small permease [Bacillota bacterium]